MKPRASIVILRWVNQIAKAIESTSIRHRSDTKLLDRCLIDGNKRVLDIWVNKDFLIPDSCVALILQRFDVLDSRRMFDWKFSTTQYSSALPFHLHGTGLDYKIDWIMIFFFMIKNNISKL